MKIEKKKRGVIRVRIDWVCPHCGFENQDFIEVRSLGYAGRRLCHCDSDSGGCDTTVVIEPTFKTTVEVRKIEGEEPTPERIAHVHEWLDRKAQKVNV